VVALQFRVVAGEKVTVLSPEKLLDVLLGRLSAKGEEPAPHRLLSSLLVRFLLRQEVAPSLGADALCLLGFRLGYYYRVFLEKNQVEVLDDSSPGPASACGIAAGASGNSQGDDPSGG
jgi:hypothetical protein